MFLGNRLRIMNDRIDALLGEIQLLEKELIRETQKMEAVLCYHVHNKKVQFITSEFPRATSEDYAAYMKAATTWGRRNVLQRMIKQGLYRVEISKGPLTLEEPEKTPKWVVVADDSDTVFDSKKS